MNKTILKNKINNFYATLATIDIAYDNCVVSTEDLNNISVLNEILYDLEDNFFTFEDIYKLHRQVIKHMHKVETKHKICRGTAIVMGIIGALLTLGIAGTSEIGHMSLLHIILGGSIGVGIIAMSTILYNKGEN